LSLRIKTKHWLTITVALIIITTVVIVPSSINANAFSLQGAINKLFGGLFHKNESTKPQHEKNTNNNSSSPSIAQSSSGTQPTSLVGSTSIPSNCHTVNGALPDPKCTPGATNPSVTQDNIKDTICLPGFSKTVRPPVSYTTPLKIKLMQAYGFTDFRSNYELDHLISLEIGGNPTDVRNLWPEPGYGQYNFHIKDRFENYLHNAVCSGSMSLSEAQKEIATDWLTNWKNAGQP
jgi:hypothetical protein